MKKQSIQIFRLLWEYLFSRVLYSVAASLFLALIIMPINDSCAESENSWELSESSSTNYLPWQRKWSDAEIENLGYMPAEVLIKFKKEKINLKTNNGRSKAQVFIKKKTYEVATSIIQKYENQLKEKHSIRSRDLTLLKQNMLDIVEYLEFANIAVIKLGIDNTVKDAIEELKDDPNIISASPNFVFKFQSNDEYSESEYNASWGIGKLETAEAWSKIENYWNVENNEPVIVAVLDSGVAYEHPDLKPNMWDGANCVNENGGPENCPNHGWDFHNNDDDPMDERGHGTHVAGIISAITASDKMQSGDTIADGIIGVSPKNTKIMAVKIGNRFGKMSKVIKGIQYAKNNGARLINASFGSITENEQAQRLEEILSFGENGGLFIASAGNDGLDIDNLDDDQHYYPCSLKPINSEFDNIVCVAATEESDEKWERDGRCSNWGLESVDVAAPGVHIYSTDVKKDTEEKFVENFDDANGPDGIGSFTKVQENEWGICHIGIDDDALFTNQDNTPNIGPVDFSIASDPIDLSQSVGAELIFDIWCNTGDDGSVHVFANGDGIESGSIKDESFKYSAINESLLVDESDKIIDGYSGRENTIQYDLGEYLTDTVVITFSWIANHADEIDADGNPIYRGCFIDNVKISSNTDSGQDQEYSSKSGTSMASPHVVGLAALLWNYRPDLNAKQVKEIILESGDDLPDFHPDTGNYPTVSGKRVNAYSALVLADSYSLPELELKHENSVIPHMGQYDFGVKDLNSFTSKIFSIANKGDGNLKFTNNPFVRITGENADHFQIVKQPDSPIEKDNESNFTLRYNPKSSGFHNAKLEIDHNGSNNSMYFFKLKGATNTFSDVRSEDWFASYAIYLAVEDVVQGYSDGTFKPKRGVTRAEVLKMAYEAAQEPLDNTSNPNFEDVSDGDWYYNYVADASAEGFIEGESCIGSNGNCFLPNETVNRAEAVKIISEVFRVDEQDTDYLINVHQPLRSFSDVSENDWFEKYVNWMANVQLDVSDPDDLPGNIINGERIIKGFPDGLFHPDWDISRAEMAKIIAITMLYCRTGPEPVECDSSQHAYRSRIIENGARNRSNSNFNSTSIGKLYEQIIDPTNLHAPELISLSGGNQKTVANPITISGPTHDDEGDQLFYFWNATGGSFSSSDPVNFSEVIWTPPIVNVTSIFKLTAVSGDRRGKISRTTFEFTVPGGGPDLQPSIEIVQPDGNGDTGDQNFMITWNDEDDGNATISLYYDNNAYGYNGTLIASGILQNDSNQYLWDTSKIKKGDYYIYAEIDDGVNPSVMDYSNGIVTVDHTSSGAISHVGAISNGEGGALLSGAASVYIKGNYAFIAARYSYALSIIDISNPENPVHLSSLVLNSSDSQPFDPSDVFVEGNYAYFTAFDASGFAVVDISVPDNPLQIASLSDGQGGVCLTDASSVMVKGNYAFVTACNSLEVVNISNPSSPTHAGQLEHGENGAKLDGAWSIDIDNNYAFITSRHGDAIEIIDISNPTNPIHVNSITNEENAAVLDDPVSVHVADGYAYVGCENMFSIIDITNINQLEGIGYFYSGDLYKDTSIMKSGQYLYAVSLKGDALAVFDISNPEEPDQLSVLKHGVGGALLDGSNSIVVIDNYAYIASSVSGSLEIADVSSFNFNAIPSIKMWEPDSGDIADKSFLLTWSDNDDGNAEIYLYYDNDFEGEDGILINKHPILEDDTTDEFVWDTSSLQDGSSYYVYGLINDGFNASVVDYSYGTVTIVHQYIPPTVNIIEPDGIDDITDQKFSISWVDNDPDSNSKILLYFDTDNSGEDGTLITQSYVYEDDETDRYIWDTKDIPEGQYYIYAVINDGVNNPVFDYSDGTVTIKHNHPPTANNDNHTVSEDIGITNLDVLTNDTTLPDTGETLTITDVSATSAGGTVAINSGTSIDYTPASNYFGIETFTYTINDGTPGSNDTSTVTITVDPINDAPTAVDNAFNVNEDCGITNLDVIANDTTLPDTGETLIITDVSAASAGGTVTINSGASIDYTPASNYFGIETFTYTINDGTSGSNDTSTVTITVDPINDTPTAVGDAFNVHEDSEITNLDVIANDTTLPDTGETLIITDVSAASAGGTVTINSGTSIDYTPASNYFGIETFTYTINDGTPDSNDTSTVTITVDPFNDAPTAIGDAFNVHEDSGITNLDVLTNDTISPDTGETLTIMGVSAASAGGTAAINSGTSIDYTPASNFFGTETFTYTINDGTLGSNYTATVTITVGTVNDAPTAVDDEFTVNENCELTNINVLTNDTISPDTGETLTITGLGATSAGGTVVINAGTSIDYTPASNFFGIETFTYTINDGTLGSNDTATVSITVNPVNDPPEITILQPDGIDDIACQSYAITWIDEDPEDDATIKLYYDTDNTGADGVLIADGISEDDDIDEHKWITSAVPDGEYFIYAIIDDKVNSPIIVYSDAAITIDHITADFSWVISLGGDNYDIGNEMAIDNDGNLFIAGGFSDTANFGNNSLESAGSGDIFIAKFDSFGNTIWAISAGGADYDIGYGIALDNNGNVYVCGIFNGIAYFDGHSLTSTGLNDIFIAKYDTDGNAVWVKSAGGTEDDYGRNIVSDDEGNIYLTGDFKGNADFDNVTLNADGDKDVFFAKYDINGDVLWAISAGGAYTDIGHKIIIGNDGSAYISGTFQDSAIFGAISLSSMGGNDVFIAKYDVNGNEIWAKRGGGLEHDSLGSMAVDPDGNILVTGTFTESASFDNINVSSVGEYDIFLIKYDTGGEPVWAKTIGGDNNDHSGDVTIDNNGNLYITGKFEKDSLFDNIAISACKRFEGCLHSDIYVARLDSIGNVKWVKTGGGKHYDSSNAIAVDNASNVFVLGNYESFANFGNIEISTTGQRDIFLTKINEVENTPPKIEITEPDGINDLADDNFAINWTDDDPDNNAQIYFYYDNDRSGEDGKPINLSAIEEDDESDSYDFNTLRVAAGTYYIYAIITDNINVPKVTYSDNPILVSHITNPAPVDFTSVVNANGELSDRGSCITNDFEGNTYAAGYFEGSIDFGGVTLVSAGAFDSYFVKFDSAGSVLWAKRIGGADTIRIEDISVDTEGNSYVVGNFYGTANFEGITLTSDGDTDIFIAKFNSNGNVSWAKSAGGSDHDSAFGVTADNIGNSYVTGYFRDIAEFDGQSLTAGGDADIFIAKYDINGNVIWARRAGGTNNDLGMAIAVDKVGDICITGRFRNISDFNGIELTVHDYKNDIEGVSDIFVAKYDSNGNAIWARRAGGKDFDLGYGIAVDNLGNIFVAGAFQYSADFGGNISLTSAGEYDAFVAKYDSHGSIIWAKRAGGLESDFAMDVGIDIAGNCYVIGNFQDTGDFDNVSLTSIGEKDIFVAKYDRNGNMVWAKKSDGLEDNYGNNISHSPDGSIFITGYFQGSMNFDSIGLNSAGEQDMFIAKLETNSENIAPAFAFTEPDGIDDATEDSYTITWTDEDPDNDASIFLFYDNDTNLKNNPGFNAIAQGISENDETDSFTWEIPQEIRRSDLYIYCVIDDGMNSPIVVYSQGPLTVNRNYPPDAVDDNYNINEDANEDFAVLVNDSDPDGDTLTIVSVTQGGNGFVFIDGDGITYTPDPDFNGSDSFTYTINDGHGRTDTATVSVTVGAVNDDPIGNDDAISTDEDAEITIDVLTNDADPDVGDSLTIDLVTQGENGVVTNNGDSVTYTPNADYNGEDAFTYTVIDGNGGSDTANVSVTVLPVNDPPVSENDGYSVDEAGTLTELLPGVLANDSDTEDDPLNAILVSDATHGSLTLNADGSFTYVHDGSETTSDSFTYKTNDGADDSNIATVSITVNPVNDPPVGNNDDASTDEDSAVTIDVLANDSDPDVGDSLTIESTTQGANGVVAIDGANLTYTPSSDFNGSDSFSYTVIDGNGGSDAAAVTVTVNAIDDGPTMASPIGDVGVDEDAGDTLIDLSAVFTDVDNDDAAIAKSVRTNSNSTLVAASISGDTLKLDYQPDQYGSATIEIRGSSNGKTVDDTFIVTVNAIDDAPVVANPIENVNVDEDAGDSSIDLSSVFTDVDNDDSAIAKSVRSNNNSSLVSVSISGNTLTLVYQANADGTATIVISGDSNGKTVESAFTVTVNAVNDAPEAVDDSTTTNEDFAVIIDVLANDSDADGDNLGIDAVTQGANGSVINSNGQITYTPNSNFYGDDSFTYTISDGNGSFAIATVAITVAPVNDAPAIQLIEPDGVDDISGDLFKITWSDEDVDDDAGVSLYYDTDNSGEDGMLIVRGISEDDSSNSYVLNTSAFAEGHYYVYAVIDDGVNPQVVDYSDGTITVTHQGGNFVWAKNAGDSDKDIGSGVVINDLGETYVTGYFQGSIDLDTISLTSSGRQDVLIAKYAQNGDVLWAKQLGGIESDTGQAIAIDKEGDIYVAGAFSGTVDFEGTLITSSGNGDLFIVKYDPDGSMLWVKSTVGGITTAKSIAVDDQGSSYVTGTFGGSVDFDGITVVDSGIGSSDIFVARYDPQGNVLWAKRAGGSINTDYSYAIDVDNQGNSYVTGFFRGSADFDDVILDSGGTTADIFIAKYSSQGNVLWAKQIAGGPDDVGEGIAVDGIGNVYVTGWFQGNSDFGGITLTADGADVFIAKYDSQGNILWVRQATGPSSQYGRAIAIDPAGNSYVTGFFGASIDFGGQSFTTLGGRDVFVAKYDTQGSFLWAKQAGGVNFDDGYGIAVDKHGNAYLTGEFQDEVDIGPLNLISNGNSDLFVAKITTANSLPLITITEPDGLMDNTDQSYTITWVDEDPDDDAIINLYYGNNNRGENGVSINQAPISEDDETDSFNWITGDISEGSYYIYAIIDDGVNGPVTNYGAGPLTISHNDPPTANDDSLVTDEDSSVTIDVLANDSDPDVGDTLIVDSTTQGANGVVTTDGANVTYTPKSDFNGSDTFTYTVSDGNGETDSATVFVTVNAIDDGPTVANPISDVTVDEDAPDSLIDLSTVYTDVDNDDALITKSLLTNSNSTLVSASISGDTLTLDFQPDQNGSATIEIRGLSNGKTVDDTFNVSVNAVDDAPVVADPIEDVNVDEDAVDSLIDLSAVFTDVDNDDAVIAKSVQSNSNSSLVTASISGNMLTLAFQADANGTATIVINGDSNGKTVENTFAVTVNAVNDAPKAVDDVATTNEDASVDIAVLGNDSDIDEDTLTIDSVTQGANGTAAINGDVVTYTPAPDFHGDDFFTYTAGEGAGGSDQASVMVTVNPINDNPAAGDDLYSVIKGGTITITEPGVLDNDDDVDNDPLATTLQADVSSGALTLNADGSLTYVHDGGETTSDSFTYTATDGELDSSIATALITIYSSEDADADGDGIPDIVENASACLDSVDDDTDNDGIPDGMEDRNVNSHVDAGESDPCEWDTDGDGHNDYDEIMSGSDPLNDASAPFVICVHTSGVCGMCEVGTSCFTSAEEGIDFAVSEGNPGNIIHVYGSDYPACADPESPDCERALYLSIDSELHDLNDNQTPENWTIQIGGGAGSGIVDGRIWAKIVDGDVFLTRPMSLGAETTELIFEYDANIAYANAGMLNGVVVTLASGDQYKAYDRMSEYNYGADVNKALIQHDDTILAGPEFPLVYTDYHYTVYFRDGQIQYKAERIPDGAVLFDFTTDIPDLNIQQITDIAFKLVSTTDNDIWMDNLAVKATALYEGPTANDDDAYTEEDSSVNIDVLANDIAPPVGNTLAIESFTEGANGSVFIDGAVITYTPDSNFNGSDSFTYTINDGYGRTSTATASVNVDAVNDDPTAENDAISTDEDAEITIDVLANDSDPDVGDTLAIESVTQGQNGVVANNGDSVTYIPSADFNGEDSFTYTVIDSNGGSATASVTVTVLPVNDPPVSGDDAYSVDEAGTISEFAPGFLANDSDVENDPLTGILVSDVSNGTLTLNADGSFTYVHDGGETTSDNFTYKANDGTDDGNTATVEIVINPVNDPPIAVNESYSLNEGGTLTEAVPGVLSNDSDEENNSLSAILVSDVSNGTLTLNPDGSFTYVHDGGETTSDSFAYKANDGTDESASATVTITITPVNDPPTTIGDSYTLDEGGTLNEETPGLLSNDSDAENDSLSAILVNDVSHGALTLNADGSFTYIHDGGESASDSFTYKANDGADDGPAATVTITVNPVNDPPVSGNDSYSINEGGTLTEAAPGVLSNDTDAENNALSTILVSNVSHGSLTLNGDGSFTYIHDGSETVSDSFTYKANDGTDDGAAATVSITINPVNDPPIAANDSYSVNENGTISEAAAGVLNNDSDAENDSLSAILVSDVSNGALTLYSDGSFTYVHNGSETTTDSFTYKLNDGADDGNTATVSITVNPVNDPPVSGNDSYSVDEGATLAETAPGILSNDSDAENNPLSTILVSDVSHGTLTLNSDGSFTYVHDGSETTSDSFTYKSNDGAEDGNTASVSITVNPVNDPPTANDDSATTDEDSAVTIDVLANDSDPDVGDTLIVESTTQGANGAVAIDGANVTYTPSSDFNGSDSFTYTVSDGNGGSDTAAVAVEVAPVNDAPVIQLIEPDGVEDISDDIFKITWIDEDPDDDAAISFFYDTDGDISNNTVENLIVQNISEDDETDQYTWDTSQVIDGVYYIYAVIDDGINPTVIEYSSGTVTIDHECTYAIQFDGVDDYVELTDFSVPESFTVEMWVNPSTTDDNQAFLGKHTSSGGNIFVVGYWGGGQHVRIRSATWNAGEKIAEYHHLAVVVEKITPTSSDVTVYRNGEVLWEKTFPDVIGDTTGKPWVLGQEWDGGALSDFFNGYIDEVRFWGSARSQAEIKQFMYTPLSGNEEGLIAYYPFNEGSGSTTSDPIRNENTGVLINDPVWELTDWIPTNTPPRITIIEPDGIDDTTDQTFNIVWSAIDEDDGATISLYYDADMNIINNTGDNLIVGGLIESDGTESYSWNIPLELPEGDYFIYGIIDDNENDPVVDYSDGPLSVDWPYPPDAVDDTYTIDKDTTGTFDVLNNDSDPDGDSLTIDSVTQGENGSVSTDGAIVIYTPKPGFIRTDSFTYTVSDGNGGSDTAAVYVNVHPPGLVGYWKFDEPGTTAYDSSGNERHATISGPVPTDDGFDGGALDFYGDGKYVHLPGDMASYVSDHFTVAMWVKVVDVKYLNYLFHSSDDRPGMLFTTDNKMVFAFKSSPTAEPSSVGRSVFKTDPLPTDQWIHVACTWNGSRFSGYVNGNLVGAVELPYFVPGGRIVVGKADGGGERSFDGLIDEVRIYDRALPESELHEVAGLVGYWKLDDLPTDAVVKDDSGYGRDGEILGEVSSEKGVKKYTLDFSGDGNYVRIPGNLDDYVTDRFSVTMWARVKNVKSINYLFHANDDRPGILFNWENRLFFVFKPGFGETPLPGESNSFSTEIMPVDEWMHIACIWDGAAFKGYVNGVFVGESVLAPEPFQNGGRIFVAKADGGPERSFDGNIDEVRIYKRALSGSEVQKIADLAGTWKFDNPDGVKLIDDSVYGTKAEIRGPVITDEGILGRALDFMGDGNYVRIPGDMDDYILDHFTVMMWVKMESTKSLNYVFHAADDQPGIMFDWENKLGFRFKGSMNAEPFYGNSSGFSTASLPTGEWMHVACTWDGTRYSGYLNGSLVGQTILPYFPMGGRIVVGKADGGGTRSFDGIIDEVKIYRRALTEAEILNRAGIVAHWKFDETDGNTAFDASGYGRDAFINGPIHIDAGVHDRALDFNGDGNYVDPPSHMYDYVMDRFTLMMWIKITAARETNYIFHAGDYPGVRLNVNNQIRFCYKPSSSSAPLEGELPWIAPVDDQPLAVGEWIHVACAWDGSKYIGYVNGDPVVEKALPYFKWGYNVIIGSDGQSNRSFDGFIDDVRIYKHALAPFQIKRIADEPTLPVNHPPVASDDAYSVSQGGDLTVDALSGVLGNDSDAEGDPLAAILLFNVSHGLLSLNADGSFTYNHDGGETTNDEFTYKVNDGVQDGNTAAVSITVAAP